MFGGGTPSPLGVGREGSSCQAEGRAPYDFLTVQAKKYDESSAQLASDIVESAQQLVRLEIALAKQEVKELAIRNGIAFGALAVAGVFVLMALLVALPVLLIVWIDN